MPEDDDSLAPRSRTREEKALLISFVFTALAFVGSTAFAFEHYTGSRAAIIAISLAFFFGITPFLFSLHVLIGKVEKELGRIKSEVKCLYIGDDEEAFRYLFSKCDNDMSLLKIFDTHMRVNDSANPFEPETYKQMEKALVAFLSRKPNPGHVECVFGQTTDHQYDAVLNKVGMALREKSFGPKSRLSIRRLKEHGPFANFMILEYKDYSEVLFGWGRRVYGESEAVFRSDDPKLVKEFATLHEEMRKPEFSDPEPVPWNPPAKKEPALAVDAANEWTLDDILTLFRTAPPGEEICIWQTFFTDDSALFPKMREWIKPPHCLNIRILMMDHENHPLVTARFRQRDSCTPVEARDKIANQMRTLENIGLEAEELTGSEQLVGSLKVHACNTMPFGCFYKFGEREMVFGVFPPLESWETGPLIHVYPGGNQWDQLKKNWEAAWKPPSVPRDYELAQGTHQDWELQNKLFKDKVFYHYHLTKTDHGTCVWVCKKLEFKWERDKLIAKAPIKVGHEDNLKFYRFELSVRGQQVVLISSLDNTEYFEPDIGVELLRRSAYFDRGYGELYGARVITTFYTREVVTTTSILSLTPLVGDVELGPIDSESGKLLSDMWVKNAQISSLPADCVKAPKLSGDVSSMRE